MKRIAPVRTTALVAAAVLAGAVAWAAVPATATSPAAHRATPVPALILDYNEAPAGKPFSAGQIKTTAGDKIGTAYSLCDQDAIAAQAKEAFCSTFLRFDADSFADQVNYTVMLPVTDPVEGATALGLVTGGTGVYEGITGNARVVPRAANTYDLNFD
ncbi:hypothetical protein [Kitasatospora purpeofusca]|uniref:hypothetical protein n=1 Tax=Kitasatospora purpeofusca TaxID=67352 RepID=UPI002A5AA0F0|nr:hypothetical protein [Kitasatospora purpeofusca]MDY0811760.1 hypothetical protein [Kitasatospora purpeofusca]